MSENFSKWTQFEETHPSNSSGKHLPQHGVEKSGEDDGASENDDKNESSWNPHLSWHYLGVPVPQTDVGS